MNRRLRHCTLCTAPIHPILRDAYLCYECAHVLGDALRQGGVARQQVVRAAMEAARATNQHLLDPTYLHRIGRAILQEAE